MTVPYYGDFPEDASVYMLVNTFDSNDPSASVTATNWADSDIHVHKDGSTTQIVTDGATVALNFDSITGNHLVTIDTSAHADYAVGSDYMVRIEGVTVDGATINAWIGSFSIENRYPAAQTDLILTDTEAVLADTEAATPVLTDTEAILADSEAVLADSEAIVADTNELQTDWTNAGRLDAILDAVLADTEAAVPVLTDTEAILADSEAVLADSEAIVADTNELQTDWVNGGRLDLIVDAILSDTEGLSAGSGLTPLASGTAQGGTSSTIQLASGETFADDELNGNVVKLTGGTGAGQARVITDHTGSTDTSTVTPNWITTPDNTSTYEIVEGSANLVAVGLTAQTAGDIIADTEATLTDTEAVLVDTEAAVPVLTDTEAILADSEAVLSDSEAILADTNELQTDWTDAGRLDAILDAVLADTEASSVSVADIQAGLGVHETTIATLASQTSFTLTAGSADDDAYNGFGCFVVDQSTSTQIALGEVSDYTGSTKTVTLSADPGIFTIATGDTVIMLPADFDSGLLTDTEAILADTEAAVTDTEAILSDSEAVLTDSEAVLTDTEAAVPVLTDTEAILADSEAVLSDSEAILADTNELQGDWTNAGRLDAILDAVLVDTEAAVTDTEAVLVDTEAAVPVLTDTEAILSDSEAVLADSEAILTDAEAIITDTENLDLGIIYGIAQTGTLSTTACTTDLTGYADDDLINRSIVFTGGDADGCGAAITDYASASGLVTFSGGIATAPANGDTFKIV